MRPPAIGYLRKDVSGSAQGWHETQIQGLAKRFKYDLAKIIAFSERVDDPLQRLLNTIASTKAEAVFVPSVEHFGGEIPEVLTKACDVVIVDTEETLARRLPTLFDPPISSEGELCGHRDSRDRTAVAGRSGLPRVQSGATPVT